ncbi:MAG: phosphatidate cytidylyltransferase [Deltaproteobacteria bacterium]|jgi:phosphatidate cytidylyltransferase|nr:phosphatidate cytidylyltransferase [Deltaproteobacteria bacterium]
MFSLSHKKRIITGFILTAALAGALAAGGWILRLLVSFTAVLALGEFFQMCWPGRTNTDCKLAGLLLCAVMLLGSGVCFGSGGLLFLLCLGSLYAGLRFLFLYAKGDDKAALQENLLLLFGLLYIPLSLQFAVNLSRSEQILVILGAIASDIGAYYAGSNFGRHKICPRVSPNKSWEGFWGGIALDMPATALCGSLASPPGLEHIPFWGWALAGLAFSLAAQAGDFFESALKRAAGVKDSSRLLPGHGGILDRLDSIIFVLSFYALLKTLCAPV